MSSSDGFRHLFALAEEADRTARAAGKSPKRRRRPRKPVPPPPLSCPPDFAAEIAEQEREMAAGASDDDKP